MATYQNPPSAFMGQYAQYGLIDIVGSSPAAPNWQLQFSSAATQPQKQLVNNAAQSFDWVPYTPPPGPNVDGFELAIMGDNSIPETAQLGLAAFYPSLEKWVSINPSIIQSGWAALVNQYQSTWLTPTVQSLVLGYAADFNIPLVA